MAPPSVVTKSILPANSLAAGTGPVGMRAAGMLAGEGANVLLTSRKLDRAQAAAKTVSERFDVKVEGVQVVNVHGKHKRFGRMAGKRALITGGANGLGAATARLLASEGARVVLADLERLEIGENG